MTGYEKASEIAFRVLRECGITGPAVPVTRICQNYGLSLEIHPQIPGKMAFLHKKHRKIVLSAMREPVMRWYVAHELGHWLLPAHYGEVSCNTFAECLLVPEPWLRSDLIPVPSSRQVPDPAAVPVPLRTALAQRYGVTESVIKIKLRRIQFSELPVRTA